MILHLLSLSLASPPQPLLDATAHAWKLADEPAAVQAVIDASVQEAALGFPALVRPFVRRILARHAFYCRQIALSPTAESWTSACVDDGKDYTRDWSAEPHVFKGYEGDDVTSVIQYDSQSITVDFQGGGGGRRSTYSPDGERLNVTVNIYAEQLPKPLVFTLAYVRAD